MLTIINLYLGQFSDPIWKPTSSFGTVTLHWTVRSSPRPGTAREGLEGRQESSELEVDCLDDVVSVVERRRRNTWLPRLFIIWADLASVWALSPALWYEFQQLSAEQLHCKTSRTFMRKAKQCQKLGKKCLFSLQSPRDPYVKSPQIALQFFHVFISTCEMNTVLLLAPLI